MIRDDDRVAIKLAIQHIHSAISLLYKYCPKSEDNSAIIRQLEDIVDQFEIMRDKKNNE